MKQLFILVFILSFHLVHLSISQARPVTEASPALTWVDPFTISTITEISPTSPAPTATCDLDLNGIQAIQFYEANCDHPDDHNVEFCAWSGLAY